MAGRIDRAGSPVSEQLSGGLDSTPLAFLARSARPLLITTAGRSVIDDNLAWARRAAGLLETNTHRVIPADEAPLFFTDLDEPAPFTAGCTRQRYVARLLGEHGTVVHFNG